MAVKTLYDNLWDSHRVEDRSDGTSLLYIDWHLLHEVTSPQPFEGMKLAGRKIWRPGANLATPDHKVPTLTDERKNGIAGIIDPFSRPQVESLNINCREQQGLTQPGMTIEFAGATVCRLSVAGRMTVCNMAIEAGARAGLVAVDDRFIDYLRARPFAPQGEIWAKAEKYWRTLTSDSGAIFDKVVTIDAAELAFALDMFRKE